MTFFLHNSEVYGFMVDPSWMTLNPNNVITFNPTGGIGGSTIIMSQPASLQFNGSRTWSGAQTAVTTGQISSFTNQGGTTSAGPAAAHFLGIATDTVQSTGLSFANLQVDTTTGAGIKGGRNNIWSNLNIHGTPADTGQYVAGTFAAQATAPANAGGNLVYGTNPTAGLSAGATGAWSVVGEEIDVRAVAGTTPVAVTGMTIVTVAGHAVHGSANLDSAISIGNQPGTTTGWDYGVRFGGPSTAFPFVAGATLLYAYPSTSGLTIAYGMDFSQLTFTSGFLKSTGFLVDGTGKVTAATVKSTGGIGAFGATPPASKPAITGSRGSATAAVLALLLTSLAAAGLITDSTTA